MRKKIEQQNKAVINKNRVVHYSLPLEKTEHIVIEEESRKTEKEEKKRRRKLTEEEEVEKKLKTRPKKAS